MTPENALVGTVVVIGHPANGVTATKVADDCWMYNDLRRSLVDYDTIHKAARLLYSAEGPHEAFANNSGYDKGFADGRAMSGGYQQGVRDALRDAAPVPRAGDELAAAAARVCAEYDGVHRLRAALSKWFDVRAGIHGSEGNS